ncbi:hypothetical protein wTpre_633 [Wolbachia endosymbiont of Trichogramma pretiosum]|nr:hypothetical protein wTpre_633 [Wolbachia endosymbiont of Trichogramma pretiosum]
MKHECNDYYLFTQVKFAIILLNNKKKKAAYNFEFYINLKGNLVFTYL